MANEQPVREIKPFQFLRNNNLQPAGRRNFAPEVAKVETPPEPSQEARDLFNANNKEPDAALAGTAAALTEPEPVVPTVDNPPVGLEDLNGKPEASTEPNNTTSTKDEGKRAAPPD